MNPHAGAVSRAGAGAVSDAARNAFGDGLLVETVSGADPADAFRRLRERGVTAVLAAGGDGTAAALALQAAETNTAIAPLPGGTMNLLARRLYGDTDLAALLPRLKAARPRPFPIAHASGRPFFLTAIFGAAYPLARLREGARRDGAGGLRDSLSAWSGKLFTRSCRFCVDGGAEARAEIVFAGNGKLKDVLAGERWDGSDLSLDGAAGRWRGVFSAGRSALLGAAGFSGLDPDTALFEFQRLDVREHGRSRTRAVIDGEPVKFDGAVRVARHPRPVPVLALET